MLRALVRLALFAGPLLLAVGIGLVLATSLGSYERSWRLLRTALDAIAPGHTPISDYGVTLYQLNDALRKLAHVGVYAAFTTLTVRLCQGGRPRLRRRTLPAAALAAVGFWAVESLVRRQAPDRHIRSEQILWDSIGVGAALLLVLLFFGVKALERWASGALQSAEETPP